MTTALRPDKRSQQHAYERFETVRLAADPDNSKPIWQNFRGLFSAIDEGNAGLNRVIHDLSLWLNWGCYLVMFDTSLF